MQTLTQRVLTDSTQTGWSDGAIRDTVAAIVNNAAYRRTLTQSLGSRIMRWVWDRVDDFFTLMSRVPHGREITIALIVAIVGLILTRFLLGVRDERMSGFGTRRRGSTHGHTVLLSDAERLAAEGDYTGAAHALFAALISASAARGEVRAHPSKTAGDYARELRRKNVSWIRSFQSFRSRYDRVIYGDMLCSPADYRALHEDVRAALEGARAT